MAKAPPSLDGFDTDTRLVLAGRDPHAYYGFVNTPIWRGSTVLYPTVEELNARRQKYVYGTRGTPTTDALETAWTELSGAAGTVLAPSGLAAIVVALFSCLKAGDHMLMVDCVYRPARMLAEGMLKNFGVETTYYDPMIGADVAKLFRPNTKVLFCEAPGSQTFEVQDIPAMAAIAHEKGALVVMDNTWATPLLFPPHERGVDLAIEAGTKYLSGHSDILLGMVSASARALPALKEAYYSMAMCPGPEDVFLGLRGLRTMGLRLKEQGERTLDMAHWFAARPEVRTVLHPALPSCPGHENWKKDFKGSSSLFSVILHPASEAGVAAMLDGLQLFGMGYSWGGFESLIVPFDVTPLRTATHWAPGWPCLRIQIGLESPADLKRDLAAGFERLNAARS
jgi:cystathionine beta-lyase